MTPQFPHTTPESQGIPSSAILDFIQDVESSLDAMHSFMLLRHGQVIAEGWWSPYHPDDPHILFSLSKSFTSTAIGLLINEGRLSLDDPVLRYFADEAPPNPSANLKAMRIRHLLSMSTGHDLDTLLPMSAAPAGSWVSTFLAQPIEYEPGGHFFYNNGAPYLLSALVRKLTGESMLDYLGPRLFTPLGIEDPLWETSPEGIEYGASGLRLTTAAIAAFGQLYLQEGLWQGERLLPQTWVKTATTYQVSNAPSPNRDWEQGYGFYFWRCQHNAYRGDGAFGQYCVVMPRQKAVLAITSGLGEMQPPLDLVWKRLLPAMGEKPLPEYPQTQANLAAKLGSLQLPTVMGQPQNAAAEAVSGKTYQLAENSGKITNIRFDFSAGEAQISLYGEYGEQHLTCGYQRWQYGLTSLPPLSNASGYFLHLPPHPMKIAGSGAWTDDATFTAKFWWIESPFALLFSCRFADKSVTVEMQVNVDFVPPEKITLHGQQE